MKKVLFVATVVKAHIMVFHTPILKWFKEKGYETYVCAKNDYDNKEDCIIPYCDHYFDVPFERHPVNLNNFNSYLQLRKIINSNDFEIIHCHTPTGAALTRLASRNARKNGSKIFYTAHGFHFYKGAPLVNWLFYFPVEMLLARQTDVLITINKEDTVRAKKYLKAKRVEYIPGVGIDVRKYKKNMIDSSTKRKELGIPKGAFVILSVGELNKNKNHEVVLRTLGKLRNSNIHYVICGQGYMEEYLKNLSTQLNIDNQVHILGFRNDIDAISKVADIFIFPSFREGLSLALMEAMASGLPVICSNIRGNIDLIDSEKGGYLINPENSRGLENNLKDLINNENKRIKFGAYNSIKILEFDIDEVIEKTTKIYQEVFNDVYN